MSYFLNLFKQDEKKSELTTINRQLSLNKTSNWIVLIFVIVLFLLTIGLLVIII